jgi:hypothetical protein
MSKSLLLIRRMMMAPPAPAGGNYVRDGLVMYLDGIDKGSNSAGWSDLVGQSFFTYNEHSTPGADSVVMDGLGTIYSDYGAVVSSLTGTIEICAQVLNFVNETYIYTGGGGNNVLSIWVHTKGLGFQRENNANGYNILKFDNFTTLAVQPFTASLQYSVGYLNGVVNNGTQADGWNNNNIIRIGGFNNASARCNVKIHSIRIYNRQLTQAEMLANQREDNTRFNLGLTI